MAMPVMANAFHIGAVVRLHGIKDAQYADTTSRWKLILVDTTKSRWILHPECGSGVWLPSRRALAAVAETAGDATARRWNAALRQMSHVLSLGEP